MSRHGLYWSVAFAGVFIATARLTAGADPGPATATLREAVLRADSSDKAAPAFKAYFLRLRRAGLPDLLKDENSGIALQAAWETHLQPAERKEKAGLRTNDKYDPAELGKFVTFFKERTKAPVPDWWASALTDVYLFPGNCHAFGGAGKAAPEKPKSTGADRNELKVEVKRNAIVCAAGSRSVEFPKETFEGSFPESFVGWLGEKRSVVAGYTKTSGFAYQVAGFVGKGGKPKWKADVWAAGRTLLLGQGHHWVEMRERDGVVYLFGKESHGAYAEAFEAASGKVQFRFCTCYWFNFSEAWGLK
jgi:hypothetical protein